MTLQPTIEDFARLVTAGIEAWTEAGRVLNSLIESDPNARNKIIKANPWMTFDVIDGFERIGRGEIYPQLLLDRSNGARRLIQLPYYKQKELCGAELKLAVVRRGEIQVETRRLQDLSYAEAQLALDDTGCRPVSEQRKLLLPKLRKREPSVREERAFIGIEPVAVESLDGDSEETIEQHLAAAQAGLIRARELMVIQKKPPQLDRFITTALGAIGNLRFELKS